MRLATPLIVASIVSCIWTIFAATACAERTVTEERQEAVEVVPGKFLTLSRVDVLGASRFIDGSKDETTELVIPWDDEEVRWKGFDIPVTLREWDGKLYMIGFDRHTDFDKPRLRYYRQSDKGDRLEEIKPASFPKQIAAQNMWLGNPDDFSVGKDGRKIYEVDLALKLDQEDVYFSSTLTAAIWCQLQAGLEYHASKPLPLEERQPILREFAAEHRPIRLLQIVQRPATPPETPAGEPAAD